MGGEMSRRLDDTLLATGPLAAALAVAVHPLAAVAVAVALVAALVGSARAARRRHPRWAPVIVVAPLAPRRVMPRPEVSVGAIVAGLPSGLRALTGDELARARVRGGAHAGRILDAELVAACWSVATRGNARMTDAAAVRLGLADAPLPRLAPGDPDALLLAATSRLAA
jgi:hypothetical protein